MCFASKDDKRTGKRTNVQPYFGIMRKHFYLIRKECFEWYGHKRPDALIEANRTRTYNTSKPKFNFRKCVAQTNKTKYASPRRTRPLNAPRLKFTMQDTAPTKRQHGIRRQGRPYVNIL